jgi:hypothetical protein
MTKQYQIQPIDDPVEIVSAQPAAAAQPEIVTYLEKAAVDVQVATAKAYPRDRQKAMQAIVAEAMMDSESMVYTLRYRDRESGETKVVKGPSIRLAEIIMQNWGNLRVWATVIESRPEYIRARGSAWDVQTNAWGNEEVIVPTLDRHGKPLHDRLRIIYQQVAISKALRNAILRVIPRSVVNTVMQAIERQQPVTPKAIAGIRDWLRRVGVSEATACRVVGAQSLDNLTPAQLSTLRGIYAAIRDGEMTVEEAFATEGPEEADATESTHKYPQETHAQPAQEPQEYPAGPEPKPQQQQSQPRATGGRSRGATAKANVAATASPQQQEPGQQDNANRQLSKSEKIEKLLAVAQSMGLDRAGLAEAAKKVGWGADFSQWPESRLDSLLSDPASTIEGLKSLAASTSSQATQASVEQPEAQRAPKNEQQGTFIDDLLV